MTIILEIPIIICCHLMNIFKSLNNFNQHSWQPCLMLDIRSQVNKCYHFLCWKYYIKTEKISTSTRIIITKFFHLSFLSFSSSKVDNMKIILFWRALFMHDRRKNLTVLSTELLDSNSQLHYRSKGTIQPKL